MATSYSEIGGTGFRPQIWPSLNVAYFGLLQVLLDGSTGNSFYFGSGHTTSELLFDFGPARVIDEAKWYQDTTTTHGVWKWQGSNDGTTFTDIGGTFTLGGTLQTQTTLNGNTIAYRYYRLKQVSGVTSNGPYIQEIEFKIDPVISDGYWTPKSYGDRAGQVTGSNSSGLFAGGTIGGLLDGTHDNGNYFNYSDTAGAYMLFDFLTAFALNEFQWSQETTAIHGTWQMQFSDDNVSFTDIGATFTLGGTPRQRIKTFDTNSVAHRYWKLLFVPGGIRNGGPWLYQIEFSKYLGTVTPPDPVSVRRRPTYVS